MDHQAEDGTFCGESRDERAPAIQHRRPPANWTMDSSRAAALDGLCREDDVKRVEEAAADSEPVAQAEAQAAVQRHSAMPQMQTSAAAMLYLSGRFLVKNHHMNGTMTQ